MFRKIVVLLYFSRKYDTIGKRGGVVETIKHRAENLNNGGSVTVYYCGYEKCESGHFWGPAVRPQYLLHYVLSGRGVYTVRGETYALQKDECFLIRPGELTVYTADKDDPWAYMWVAFDGFDVLEILRRTGFISQYVVRLENGALFAQYLQELIAEFNAGSLFKVMSCFYGAMSVLEKTAKGGVYTREYEYVNKAIGYIKSNYGYPIQIHDLARYIGIDRTYLYRIFTASENMSPKQYLMQVRINAAKKMLLTGAYSVAETALSCGFADSASFCGRFKRCTNKTPKEFVADSQKHHAN